MRALSRAPAHITQGSRVTYSVQSSSRHEPTRGGVAQGEHLGVGGRVVGELALVVPAGDHLAVATTTAPTGTSPCSKAALASSRATVIACTSSIAAARYGAPVARRARAR